VDLGGCLDALADQFGTSKGAKLMEVANEANRALAELFKELVNNTSPLSVRQCSRTRARVSLTADCFGALVRPATSFSLAY